jgi:serine phosphatase RsbU (regulator of sigma subunit)
VTRRDGSVQHLHDDLGGMLGVAPARRRGTASLPLFEGDRVVLYTDGLFERRRESIEIGLTRLVDTVRACQGRPLARFCDDLITAMFARTRQTDDMALLAIDVSPAAATNGTRG